jgi:23S rRNA (adenine2503-C2)-methyltransferase
MTLTSLKSPRVVSLYDLTPPELESFFHEIREEKYRARQILDFLYKSPVTNFDGMTTLSKSLRQRLSETFQLAPMELRTTAESKDGTVKHAYEIRDKARNKILLERVWMPAEKTDLGPSGRETAKLKGKPPDRFTLCISSQLGCAAGCKFCATGKVGLKGQLTTGEIVWQVVHALMMYGQLPDTILFMGMGEPMHNLDAVTAAVEIFSHPDALGISHRRIVVSTCGEMERLRSFHSKFPRIRIAISLNAASDDLRSGLMPVNDAHNLRSIQSFIKSAGLSGKDKITLEYVVLDGVNNTGAEIAYLVKFLKPLAGHVKVNLIPYNHVEGIRYKSPEIGSVLEIQRKLIEIDVSTFIRKNRGRGASAACGQLSGRY